MNNPNFQVHENIQPGYVGFSVRETVDGLLRLAQVEINMVGEIWEFNRLIVPPALRNKGIATLLVRHLVRYCEDNRITLICGLNPYGDLDFNQLRDFYIKNGFHATDIDEVLVLPFGDRDYGEYLSFP